MSVVETIVTDVSVPGIMPLYGLKRSVLLAQVETNITFPSLKGYAFTIYVAASYVSVVALTPDTQPVAVFFQYFPFTESNRKD